MSSNSNYIHWNVEAKVKNKKHKEISDLIIKMKDYVAKEESQTLEYDFYFNEDKSKLYINECYSNNEAALEHLNNFNQFSEEFFKNIEILKVNMFGPVNDKIRSIFASQNTIFWSKTK
jgi:quinol monooxygenase YgiN